MVEREVIVSKQKIIHEGLFSATELYSLIDSYFESIDYDKREIKNIESVRDKGKYVEIEMEPHRKITDFVEYKIHLRMIMENLTEVVVEKGKRKIRTNKGKLQLVFDAYVETDYEARWEDRPILYIIRALFNKFLYPAQREKYANEVGQDLTHLVSNIKSYLNIFQAR